MQRIVDKRWAGAKLRLIRELAGVSRDAMAEACGVSAGAVSHWEMGRSVPNGWELGVWARQTGVPIDVLYEETGLVGEPEASGLWGWWRARHSSRNGPDGCGGTGVQHAIPAQERAPRDGGTGSFGATSALVAV